MLKDLLCGPGSLTAKLDGLQRILETAKMLIMIFLFEMTVCLI